MRGFAKKRRTGVFEGRLVPQCTYIYTSVSARIGGTWNKFRELSGMLVRKQGLSIKQAGKICVLC